jgi:pentatricopeptide repeat protein
MYLASGDHTIAEELFIQIKEPMVHTYVAMMNYFNKTQQWHRTIQLYDQMKVQRRTQPDIASYLSVLFAVKNNNDIEKAREIQEDIVKQNLWQNHTDIGKCLKEIFETSKA